VTSCADKGVCVKKPDLKQTGDLVCGCDGVTYWNLELAASYGVSVNPAYPSECQGNARKTCSGVSPCPTGRHCNYNTTASNGICAIETIGECWGLPAQCPALVNPSGSDNVAKDCATGNCSTFCTAIKNQKNWYATTYNKCN
jgi:hypothetical protein